MGLPSRVGGGKRIRTSEPLPGLTVFKTAGFNRSPIPPRASPFKLQSLRGTVNLKLPLLPLNNEPETMGVSSVYSSKNSRIQAAAVHPKLRNLASLTALTDRLNGRCMPRFVNSTTVHLFRATSDEKEPRLNRAASTE